MSNNFFINNTHFKAFLRMLKYYDVYSKKEQDSIKSFFEKNKNIKKNAFEDSNFIYNLAFNLTLLTPLHNLIDLLWLNKYVSVIYNKEINNHTIEIFDYSYDDWDSIKLIFDNLKCEFYNTDKNFKCIYDFIQNNDINTILTEIQYNDIFLKNLIFYFKLNKHWDI